MRSFTDAISLFRSDVKMAQDQGNIFADGLGEAGRAIPMMCAALKFGARLAQVGGFDRTLFFAKAAEYFDGRN